MLIQYTIIKYNIIQIYNIQCSTEHTIPKLGEGFLTNFNLKPDLCLIWIYVCYETIRIFSLPESQAYLGDDCDSGPLI